MKFSDWLVITEDGKVGNLLARIMTQDGYLYITDIPNDQSEQTGYTENEIELVEKKQFH